MSDTPKTPGRITEDKLQRVEEHYEGSTGGSTPLMLVVEVRRLRGLIVGGDAAISGLSGLGVHSGSCDLTRESRCAFCRHLREAESLQAEAEAIRAETR